MSNIIAVYELAEVSLDELGNHVGTFGYFKTREAAERFQNQGHFHPAKIITHPAVELDTGEVYLLQQADAITFGLKK